MFVRLHHGHQRPEDLRRSWKDRFRLSATQLVTTTIATMAMMHSRDEFVLCRCALLSSSRRLSSRLIEVDQTQTDAETGEWCMCLVQKCFCRILRWM